MINIHPAGHRVLVKLKKVDAGAKKSAGGIIIELPKDVEAMQNSTQEAYVVELGMTAYRGFDDGEPWCQPGDLVRIAKYAGS